MKINEAVLKKTAKLCKERGVVIPTFAQMKNPSTAPAKIHARLKKVGMNDLDPANLFRITWKNDAKTGLFGDVNYLEIPREIT
ncbi:MAG: pyridoxal-5-phosphate-dependent protein subunit beta, partial [Elusimicrobia bacterium]|nr:pyridoxal-5-phosphate-dependent protein subunit beta [Elusimicrobiota bacterium]